MPRLKCSSFASYPNSQAQDFRSGPSPLSALCMGTQAHAKLEMLQQDEQRPLREANPELNLKKVFWNDYVILVCLWMWLRKITFFSSNPCYLLIAVPYRYTLTHFLLTLTMEYCPARIGRKLYFSSSLNHQNNSLINGCLFSLHKIRQK